MTTIEQDHLVNFFCDRQKLPEVYDCIAKHNCRLVEELVEGSSSNGDAHISVAANSKTSLDALLRDVTALHTKPTPAPLHLDWVDTVVVFLVRSSMLLGALATIGGYYFLFSALGAR